MLSVVDLFCGSGGFSLGAHLAKFRVIASIDKDLVLTSSYSKNFPNSVLLHKDITGLTARDIARGLNKTTLAVDGVIGGPPCQGFSLMGRRDVSDPRNELVAHFFRLVNEISPKFFIMENVPGIIAGRSRKTLDDQIQKLTDYNVIGPLVVDAHELGAATKRKRIVVIGYKPQHFEPISEEDVKALNVPKQYSVRDAISDIPAPKKLGEGKYKRSSNLSEYADRCRQPPPYGLGSASSRSRLKEGKVGGLLPTEHAAAVVERFSRLAQGEVDAVSRFPRLDWNKPCPTLRAGTGADRGSHQAARPLHPEQPRVITVREAARLQGFPDWFDFHETKWHSFRMIGNSVSPIMAEALLSLVKAKMK
jgi:DNA (cytosine-5)-methyltransferase 1